MNNQKGAITSMTGWQPIETAPKDREDVILAAHFIGDQWLVSAGWHWTWHSQPTHWILPPGAVAEPRTADNKGDEKQ